MWKIFAVKSIIRNTVVGKPIMRDKDYSDTYDLIEERIVLLKARNLDEALSKGEKESEKYCADSHINPYGQEVVSHCTNLDAFETYDELKKDALLEQYVEIFSTTCLVPRKLSNAQLNDRLSGPKIEDKRERNVRVVFCNREFSGMKTK